MTTQTPPPARSISETIETASGEPAARIEALLSERSRMRSLRRILAAVVLLIAAFLIWGLFAQVDELARARGEIQPGGHVRSLQTEEGGVIVKLHVKDGDVVQAGQAIADFAATDLGKQKRQIDVRLASFEIDRERMRALLEGREPDLQRYATEYPLLVEQARVAYRAELVARNATLTAKRSEGAQQTEMLGGSEKNKELLAQEVAEARERVRRVEQAAERGIVTKMAVTEARLQLSALEERQAEVTARSAGTRNTISGVAAQVEQLRAEMNQRLSLELGKVTEQYRELLAERSALEERQGRSSLRAPVDGIVMNLPQSPEGAVIAPGGVVAEIVPANEEIVMEAMVSPRDIGFVKAGQHASVKIDSFDSARFGVVDARVRRVAPTSTKLKENGASVYLVELALAKPYVGAQSRRLMPGMTGEADIATGRKSVMQYLLKPIFLASDTAFHER